MQPTSNDVDAWQGFLLLIESSVLENLKNELPTYLTKAADLDSNIDPLEWWRTTLMTCPVGLLQLGISCLFSHPQLPQKGYSPCFRTQLALFKMLHLQTIYKLQ